MNLVICLLVTRRNLTRGEIRRAVAGYDDQSDEAFERMFERDKSELREQGVVIDVAPTDVGFEDEQGYRILRDEFELPEISFPPDEAALLGVAARVWQNASLASATTSAISTLRAAGVETDTAHLSAVEPRIAAMESAFDPIWAAAQARRVTMFDYRRPGQDQPSTRTIEPWRLMFWHGRWYVLGHDRDRDEARMFRLSRIEGEVRTKKKPQAYEIPGDVDFAALAERLVPLGPIGEAVVDVRDGTCAGLRRMATGVDAASRSGWHQLRIPFSDAQVLSAEVAACGSAAVIHDPAEVRDAVIRRLRGVLDATPGEPSKEGTR